MEVAASTALPARDASPLRKRREDEDVVGSRGRFALRVAPGNLDVDVGSGTNLKGDTSAVGGGLEFEMVSSSGFGGGVQVDLWSSDSDLFRRQLPALQTSATGYRVMPHATLGPRWDRGRLPFRVGPEVVVNSTEFSGASRASVDWVGVGGHLQFEPEIDFFRGDGAALSIYGRLGGGIGVSVASSSLNSNDYTTTYSSYVAEGGLRLQLAAFLIAGGYMARGVSYDESDPVGSSFVEATDFVFQGGFLEVGVRW